MRRALAGHSLIEMLVVVGIAAAAAAIVLPPVAAGREVMAVQAGAHQLAAGLAAARAEAFARQRDVTWGAKGYRLPQGVQFVETPAEIRFFADGGSSGGRIALQAGRRGCVIEVDRITGRVRQHE